MGTVAIIGAGPVGCYTGELLARLGFSVDIYEEHETIGRPVQCTGIVTPGILDMINIPERIITCRVKKASIFSPDGNSVQVRFRSPDLVLDRASFDSWMAERAVKAGAKLFTRHRFEGFTGSSCIIRKGNTRITLKYRHVIGADGPLSQVAQAAGIFGKRSFFQGIQAIVRRKNDGSVGFYPHIGTIGWMVPESPDTVRIGVMARIGAKTAFTALLEHLSAVKNDIREIQGGLIPEYSATIHTAKGKRIFLVGDAACHVKATTGGGIIPGLLGAKALARSIEGNIPYEKEWKKEVGRSLSLHLIMRKAFDRMGPEDYRRLVRMFRNPGLRKALGEVDRDNPAPLLLKCLFREPRLLAFSRFLF